MQSLAKSVGMSNRYVTDICFVAAELLLEKHALQLQESMDSLDSSDALCLQVIFDETDFRVVPTGEARLGSPERVSVMAEHASVQVHSQATGHPLLETLLLPQVISGRTAASVMWTALQKMLPQVLAEGFGLVAAARQVERPLLVVNVYKKQPNEKLSLGSARKRRTCQKTGHRVHELVSEFGKTF